MTTTRYPEADTQDTLWPEDRIETLLTAGCFDAEPAGERYARLLGADAPGKGSGADSPTIHLWLGCRCAGWAEPPSGEEFTPRSARLSRAGGRSQSSTPGRTRRRGPRHCRPGRSTPTRCASWRRRCTGRDWPDAGSPRPSTGGRRTATSPNHERRTAAVARAGRHTVDENPGTAEASPGEPRRTNGAEARRLDRAEVDGGNEIVLATVGAQKERCGPSCRKTPRRSTPTGEIPERCASRGGPDRSLAETRRIADLAVISGAMQFSGTWVIT